MHYLICIIIFRSISYLQDHTLHIRKLSTNKVMHQQLCWWKVVLQRFSKCLRETLALTKLCEWIFHKLFGSCCIGWNHKLICMYSILIIWNNVEVVYDSLLRLITFMSLKITFQCLNSKLQNWIHILWFCTEMVLVCCHSVYSIVWRNSSLYKVKMNENWHDLILFLVSKVWYGSCVTPVLYWVIYKFL